MATLFDKYSLNNIDTIINQIPNSPICQIVFNKEITLKLLSNFKNSEDLFHYWKKMTKDGRWNNIRLVYGKDIKADYYVIINKPEFDEFYEKKKSIVFRMEPDCEINPYFNDWYSNKDDFLYFASLDKFHNNGEWWMGKNYSELATQQIVKDKDNIVSSIVSSLYTNQGHKLRIDFLKWIEERGELKLDIYGKDNKFNFKNYIKPLATKDDGLIPYKYTFICENSRIENYITEKLLDCILSETVCFYWGCPNISDFFSPLSYIHLDKLDISFEQCYNIMKSSIENDEWSKRINHIRTEKFKILNLYSFMPRTESLISFSRLRKYIISSSTPVKFPEFIKNGECKVVDSIVNIPLSEKNKLVIPSEVLMNDNIDDVLVLSATSTTCKYFIDKLSSVHKTLKIQQWDILVISSSSYLSSSCFTEIANIGNEMVDITNYILNGLSLYKLKKWMKGNSCSLKIIKTVDSMIN
jgi:hypothetical protein